MTDVYRIRRGGVEDLSLVEPLWVAVHHRHVESMPELAPYVDDRQTWAARSALYRDLLAQPDSLLLVASAGDEVVGYGLAHIHAVEDTWVYDTWRTGDRIGEIESLSVLPAHRGSGLGTRLLDELEGHLRALGVRDLVLGALPGNDDAIRLYERRGYRPAFLYMAKFESWP
jgi:ribosomal protein S18 acetylase RimI-like enzyme